MKPELIVDAPIVGQKRIWIKKIYKPHFDHPFHFHKLCELTWIERGHGKLIIGDYLGDFSEGELMLSSPELPHLWKCDKVFYERKEDISTKAVGLYFPRELINEITDDQQSLALYNSLMLRAERGLRFSGETKRRVTEKLRELINSNGLVQLGIFLTVIDLLARSEEYEALASVNYKRSTDENDMNRFDEVYQFLLQNYHRSITLDEVAGICSMSPNAFCRFFKQRTQKTFTRFLNEIRIGHAKRLLQNDNLSIKDVCYDCGYNNPVNFFSFFKQITGETPKSFRMRLHRMKGEHLEQPDQINRTATAPCRGKKAQPLSKEKNNALGAVKEGGRRDSKMTKSKLAGGDLRDSGVVEGKPVDSGLAPAI